MVALHAVRPDRDQKVSLGLTLNTFCHREHFKLMRYRDQRLSQHLIVGVFVNVSGKVAIDLYQIKEEILKVAKRRHSRPEIIERKRQTVGLHFFHETNYNFWQLHCAVFADLKDQPIRMKRRTG